MVTIDITILYRLADYLILDPLILGSAFLVESVYPLYP